MLSNRTHTRVSLTALPALVGACVLLAGCVSTTGAAVAPPTTSTAAVATSDAPTPTTTSGSDGVGTVSDVTAQTVAYATASPTQTMTLTSPQGTGPFPVVALFHPGAFMSGDTGMEDAYAQALIDNGFAVANVNYRLSGEAPYPAGAQDAKAAIRWLRANASQYNLNPDEIGVWGQSAGGYLANLVGATGDQATIFDDDSLGNADVSSAVQAVVSWFGPSDFGTMDDQLACGAQSQTHGDASSPESAWLGEPVSSSDTTATTNLASYVATSTALPAWYLAHGDSDCLVPGGQSAELADAITAAGGNATYVVLKGAGHADPAFDSTQLDPTIAFLKEQLAGQ